MGNSLNKSDLEKQIKKEFISLNRIDKDYECNFCDILSDTIYLFSNNPEHKIKNYADLNNIPTKLLADSLNFLINLDKERFSFYDDAWHELVAPERMIQNDFQVLLKERNLYSSLNSSLLAIILASLGRAQTGYGIVYNNHSDKRMSYPTTNLNNILNAVSRLVSSKEITKNNTILPSDYFVPKDYRSGVQKTIDDFVHKYIDQFFKNPFSKVIKIKKEDKILGFTFPFDFNLDVISFYKGFNFVANMDTYDPIRMDVFDKYGLEMGGGTNYLFKINELYKYFDTQSELSLKKYKRYKFFNFLEHDKLINLFESLGIVKKLNPLEFDTSIKNPTDFSWKEIQQDFSENIFSKSSEDIKLENLYVRIAKGKGVSDDIALTISPLLPDRLRPPEDYNESKNVVLSLILGAILADRLDTYEKASNLCFEGGQDGFIDNYLNKKFELACRDPKFREFHSIKKRKDENYILNEKSDLVHFTFAAANKNMTLHSSMRYFTKNQKDTCMYEQLIKTARNLLLNFNIKNNLSLPHEFNSKLRKQVKVGFHKVDFENYYKQVEEIYKILSQEKIIPLDSLEKFREQNINKYSIIS